MDKYTSSEEMEKADLLEQTLATGEKYNFFKASTKRYNNFIEQLNALRSISDLKTRYELTTKLLKIYAERRERRIANNADSSIIDVYNDLVDELEIEVARLTRELNIKDELEFDESEIEGVEIDELDDESDLVFDNDQEKNRKI